MIRVHDDFYRLLKHGHEKVNNHLFKKTMGKTIKFTDYTKLLKDCNSSPLGLERYNIGGMRKTLHPIKRGQRSKHVYLTMFNFLGMVWFSSLLMLLIKVMF